MCSGQLTPSPAAGDREEAGKLAPETAAALLEMAASDDLEAFRRAVEREGSPLDVTATWYARSFALGTGRGRLGCEQRSPLMIASLYGSSGVLGYILSACPAEAARRSPSDGATALHCAASGGAPRSLDVVRLLLEASADVEAVDAGGNRAGDVIARQVPTAAGTSTTRSLEVALKAQASPPARTSSPGKEEGEKKKEYPLDLTLPDIKNGIYSTDEFRMYTFKVKPCSRAYSHDWTECPFVHPGENARRRDPKKYSYSCVPCPEFRKGTCRNGDACEYAHGVFECWLHPAQYRTKLCKDETACNRRVCFFAHKPEELRQVNPSAASVATGSMVLPSPRSSSPGLSSLDIATALMLMQQQQQPGSPMSPSSSPGLGGAATAAWINQSAGVMTPPSLQLPASRLKASLRARDLEFDLDLLGLESYQQKLIDEISSTASPRANWGSSSLPGALRASSEYNDLLGSVDPSLLTQLQGLSMKQPGPQFQSPTGIQKHQSQLLPPGFGGSLASSPPVSAASSFGPDHSMAKAILNSRTTAFAKRSQSFIDRGALSGRQSTLSAMTTAPPAPSVLSDWGSPGGKLDWGLQGEELNKLKRSATFAVRNNQSPIGGGLSSAAAAATPARGFDEPDLSWVQSLVKDGPATATTMPIGRPGLGLGQQQNNAYQINGGSDFHGSDMFSPWAEQEKLMA